MTRAYKMTVKWSTAFGCPEELYLFFTMTLMFIAFYKFQALFGVKCTYCLRFISGKVLQAGENNHFHPTCARCTKCGEPFGDGEEMFLQVIDRVILFLIILILSNTHNNYITPFGDGCFYAMQNKCSSPQLQLKTPFTRAGFEPNTCRPNSNGQAKKRQELTYGKWQIGQTGSGLLVVIKNAAELTILWFEKRQITWRREPTLKLDVIRRPSLQQRFMIKNSNLWNDLRLSDQLLKLQSKL